MSALLTLQQEFAYYAARLILKAHQMGFAVKLGDARRSVEEERRLQLTGGTSYHGDPVRNAHVRQLALDLLLFEGDRYLTETTEYQELGQWWEQQHPAARWGGRWSDGNHFSFTYEGIK